MNYFNLLIVILVTGCHGNCKNGNDHNDKRGDSLIVETRKEEGLVAVEGAIGVIVTSNNYQFGDTIHVFDRNKRLLKDISMTDENQELVLKCISKNDTFYEVKLENGALGFIPRNEKGVKFQTWQEHILSVFAVGFDEGLNPLREEASESSNKVHYNQDEFYHPNKINGDWLQVKWGLEGSWQYAWVKWKKNEKLLIGLFYFA